MSLRHLNLSWCVLTAVSWFSAVAAAQDIEYPDTLHIQGKAKNPFYEIEFNQRINARKGNWTVNEDGCSMPTGLQLEGSVAFELRANGKIVKSSLKVTGQKTSNKTVFLLTDAGVDLPLDARCMLDLRRDAPTKPISAELKQLVQDAIAYPSPLKLYRLAQYQAHK